MKKPITYCLNLLFFLHIFLAFLVVFENYLKIPFWVQPLGRMHPLLLHFPVAFIALLLLLNVFKKQIDPQSFEKINYSLLLLTSLTTVITTIMGLLLSLEGYESETMLFHKWIGIAISFVIYVLIWTYQSKRIYQVLLYSCFIGVIFGGHFGASLTHGSNFIIEPITSATKIKINANTPIYAAYVAPILKEKCTNCHNAQKHKGDLDLSNIKAITKGGENGKVWLAFKPDESLLLDRIKLPIENDEHMPPDGKTQLTNKEITLLRSWIASGANTEISYALLKKEDSLKQVISKDWLKIDSDKITYSFEFADSQLIETLNNPYRTVVQKSPNSPAIEVSIYGRSSYKTEFLTDLSQLKEQITYLNLANLPINDKDIEFITQFKNLEHLVINFTDISNEAIKTLIPNSKLESLSIAGTQVDFAGLKQLGDFKNLKEIFIWNTKTDVAEIKELIKILPNANINEGYIPNPKEKLNLTPPVLVGNKNIISSGDQVALAHEMDGTSIYYTLDNSEPDETSKRYTANISLDLTEEKSRTIRAIAYKDQWLPSEIVSYVFYDKGIIADTLSVVHAGILSSYTGDAATILTDNTRFNKKIGYTKFWASFNILPLIAIADFNTSKPKISEVVLSFGIRENIKKSPIKLIAVWESNDNKTWTLLKKSNFANEKNKDKLREISIKFPAKSYSYLKIIGQPQNDNTIHINQLSFY